MTVAVIEMPDLALLVGSKAFHQALKLLIKGGKIDAVLRGTLVRAFGRQPMMRALWAVEAGAMVLEQVDPHLHICASDPRLLSRLKDVISEAWAQALETFGEAPLVLIQHPLVFGPRLAATPVVGLGFIQFPLFPAEGREEAARAARHEICHTFCWSGRRFLDEALADFFAGGVGPLDDGDRVGPSTRAMLEMENGSDLHFERHAQDAAAATRLRRRGVALAEELVTRLGWNGVRELCEDLLTRPGPDAADAVERALDRPLSDWDKARGDVAHDPVFAARERLEWLERNPDEAPPALLREVDGLLRDVRRMGGPGAVVTELLARRAALGARGASRASVSRAETLVSTVTACARSQASQSMRAGGIGLELGQVTVGSASGFRLELKDVFVRPGERVGIIGPNGSGKSTLLSWITAGGPNLKLDGEAAPRWLRSAANRARIGTCLSDYPYHPAARVREVLALHRSIYGEPDAQVALEFDMSGHADQRLSELSTGWRKTLGLFFAFAHAPQLVLLDEPSLGLDEKHAHALRRLLDPQTNSRAQTILVSSHVGADLAGLDRMLVLARGRLVTDAAKDDLLNAYGRSKAFVLDPCAIDFGDELRSLPGLRGARRDGDRLRLFGGGEFSAAFTALAARLNLVSFGIEPATADDILAFSMEA